MDGMTSAACWSPAILRSGPRSLRGHPNREDETHQRAVPELSDWPGDALQVFEPSDGQRCEAKEDEPEDDDQEPDQYRERETPLARDGAH